MQRKRAGELIVFSAPETRSMMGSMLDGLPEAFPEGYFAGIKSRYPLATAKYRQTAKYRATRAARDARNKVAA